MAKSRPKTDKEKTMAKNLFNKSQVTPAAVDQDNRLQLEADKVDGPKAVVHPGAGQAVVFADLGFDVDENMEGVEPRLPQIGIVHQAQMFKMPDDSKVDSIVGVIIESNRTNAYWAKSIDEGGTGNLPDCFSFDGLLPASEETFAPNCAACLFNRYGSEAGKNGEAGRGKACKNSRRVHILLPTEKIPSRLTLPPSSLRTWDDYMVDISKIGRPYPTVLTKIRLEKAKNKSGIEYAKTVFEMVAPIDDRQELLAIKDLRLKFRSAMRTEAIVLEEAKAAENGSERPADPFGSEYPEPGSNG
jgi:hypothetical protein